MNHDCSRCGESTNDGYLCRKCARDLSDALREAAGHAEDAPTVIARQTRYGGNGGGGRERALPVDFDARESYDIAQNTIGTWARHVTETRGIELPARRPIHGPLCGTADCGHPSCAAAWHRKPPGALADAAAWLATQTDWLRHQREAREAVDELHDACRMLRQLVDRPGREDRLVGMCDCGRILYAPHGRDIVQCRASNCGMTWDVDESQEILRDALDEKPVTAADAAHLAAYLDTDRTQLQIRKLVNKWASRGLLDALDEIPVEHRHAKACTTDRDDQDGPCVAEWDWIPRWRFGDIADRLAATPRRQPARTA